jgi:hypothetical protein
VLRRLLIGCASSVLLIQTASAQTAALSWPPLSHLSESSLYTDRTTTPLSPRSLTREAPDTIVRQIRPTHWKEGGLVGALLLGAFGIWFGNEICRRRRHWVPYRRANRRSVPQASAERTDTAQLKVSGPRLRENLPGTDGSRWEDGLQRVWEQLLPGGFPCFALY